MLIVFTGSGPVRAVVVMFVTCGDTLSRVVNRSIKQRTTFSCFINQQAFGFPAKRLGHFRRTEPARGRYCWLRFVIIHCLSRLHSDCGYGTILEFAARPVDESGDVEGGYEGGEAARKGEEETEESEEGACEGWEGRR